MSYGAFRNTKYSRSIEGVDPYALDLWYENDERAWEDWLWEKQMQYSDSYDCLRSMNEYYQFKLLNFLVKLLIWPAKEAMEERYW